MREQIKRTEKEPKSPPKLHPIKLEGEPRKIYYKSNKELLSVLRKSLSRNESISKGGNS